jgi:hypothetical protein
LPTGYPRGTAFLFAFFTIRPFVARFRPFTRVTLPRDLPVRWKDLPRKEQTTVVTLYQLKAIRQGGVLLNYRSQLATIAASFGYSASKLRIYVQRLLDKGWVTRTGRRGAHLTLISTRRLATELGCQSTRFLHVDFADLADLRERLQVLALDNGLAQQRYQVHQKTLDQTLRSLVGIQYPQNLSVIRRRHYAARLHPSAGAETERLAALPRYEQEQAWNLHNEPAEGPNLDVTYGRRGLAKLFNYRSPTSGHRLMRRLAAKGHLTDTPRARALHLERVAKPISYAEYQIVRQHLLIYNPCYRFRPLGDGSDQGFILRRLPNLIKVITPGRKIAK